MKRFGREKERKDSNDVREQQDGAPEELVALDTEAPTFPERRTEERRSVRRERDSIASQTRNLDRNESVIRAGQQISKEQFEAVGNYLVSGAVPPEMLPSTSRAYSKQERERTIIKAIETFAKNIENRALNIPESRTFYEALMKKITGLGVLQELLDDPEVTEIVVQNAKTIRVERGNKIEETDLAFESEQELLDRVKQFTALAKENISGEKPYVDFTLPDGTRINAVIAPMALDSTLLTIRRAKSVPFSLEDLMDKGMFNKDMFDWLTWARKAHLNILVAGATGSGKSTFLESLISVEKEEEVLLCEEVAELKPDHPRLRRIVVVRTSEKTKISLNTLIRNSLRMRPDIIVVGEVRGPEAEALIWALTTGHRGGMSTIHAENAEQACDRLAIYASGPDSAYNNLPKEMLMKTITNAIDVVISLRRHPRTGQRMVWSIDEVTDFSNGSINVHNIYAANLELVGDNTAVSWQYNSEYAPSESISDRIQEAQAGATAHSSDRPSEAVLRMMRTNVKAYMTEALWAKAHAIAVRYLEFKPNDQDMKERVDICGQALQLQADNNDISAQEIREQLADVLGKSPMEGTAAVLSPAPLIIERVTEVERTIHADVASDQDTLTLHEAAAYLTLPVHELVRLHVEEVLVPQTDGTGDVHYPRALLHVYRQGLEQTRRENERAQTRAAAHQHEEEKDDEPVAEDQTVKAEENTEITPHEEPLRESTAYPHKEEEKEAIAAPDAQTPEGTLPVAPDELPPEDSSEETARLFSGEYSAEWERSADLEAEGQEEEAARAFNHGIQEEPVAAQGDDAEKDALMRTWWEESARSSGDDADASDTDENVTEEEYLERNPYAFFEKEAAVKESAFAEKVEAPAFKVSEEDVQLALGYGHTELAVERSYQEDLSDYEVDVPTMDEHGAVKEKEPEKAWWAQTPEEVEALALPLAPVETTPEQGTQDIDPASPQMERAPGEEAWAAEAPISEAEPAHEEDTGVVTLIPEAEPVYEAAAWEATLPATEPVQEEETRKEESPFGTAAVETPTTTAMSAHDAEDDGLDVSEQQWIERLSQRNKETWGQVEAPRANSRENSTHLEKPRNWWLDHKLAPALVADEQDLYTPVLDAPIAEVVPLPMLEAFEDGAPPVEDVTVPDPEPVQEEEEEAVTKKGWWSRLADTLGLR